MKAWSLEWGKNCFSRGTFDLPHQRVLNFGMGLEWRSGARTKRFHELDSSEWLQKGARIREKEEETAKERTRVATLKEKGKRGVEGAHSSTAVGWQFDFATQIKKAFFLVIGDSNFLSLNGGRSLQVSLIA